ncbi:MAG TPA: DUF2231 domain-containing protein [Nocardioidaceae bacterium]
MEIAGLPLHPLLVHATVVMLPLSATATALLAVVPRWRWLTRWPAAVLGVLAPALAWLARTSGKALLDARPQLAQLVEEHEELGELLAWASIPYALVVLLGAWLLPGPSPLPNGRGGRPARSPVLERLLPVVLVLAAIPVLVLVVLAGDSGARAVWG